MAEIRQQGGQHRAHIQAGERAVQRNAAERGQVVDTAVCVERQIALAHGGGDIQQLEGIAFLRQPGRHVQWPQYRHCLGQVLGQGCHIAELDPDRCRKRR